MDHTSTLGAVRTRRQASGAVGMLPARAVLVTGGVTTGLLALIVVVASLLLPSSGAALPTTPPIFGMAYGNTLIGMPDADLDQALDDAVEFGMSTVRMDLGWNDVQPDGPNTYSWGRTDRVVDEARERGLALIMVVAYAPQWAQAPGCEVGTCPPADPTAIAPFARAAAERYADRGVLAWEIWNEPNVAGFWGPQVDPAAFTRLLRSASDAIRAVDAHATVLLGGLASVPDAAAACPRRPSSTRWRGPAASPRSTGSASIRTRSRSSRASPGPPTGRGARSTSAR